MFEVGVEEEGGVMFFASRSNHSEQGVYFVAVLPTDYM
jgi:hypothetical protein